MTRANPLLDDVLDSFEPKPSTDKPRLSREAIDQVARENGFVSRDAQKLETAVAAAAQPVRRGRRYTTGRNQQFNMKAKPDTIERFNALCELLNVPQGALLEQAVELLEKKHRDK